MFLFFNDCNFYCKYLISIYNIIFCQQFSGNKLLSRLEYFDDVSDGFAAHRTIAQLVCAPPTNHDVTARVQQHVQA